MTDEQKQWLSAHPEHKSWKPHGIVSVYGWTDIGYLYPNGTFVPEGKHHWWAWPMHLMSSGDTLHVVPKAAIKVGREFMMA